MGKEQISEISKAVIPAAGFGTRFLPETKAMPKEMLPIVDKPIIQIVVEELVDAGVIDIIIVTGIHKRAIEDHFDRHPELEAVLERNGKLQLLNEIQRINSLANFIYIRQKGPIGNAVAIENALSAIGEEPFLVFWGDDFIKADPSRARQLIAAYQKYRAPILGAIRTDKEEDTWKYGFAKGPEVEGGIIEVKELIEKPGPNKAPSNLATVSGFLLTSQVAPYIKRAVREIQDREANYIDAISEMIKDGLKVYALELENAKYYDTGSKLGYVQAIIDLGMKHPEIGEDLKGYLRKSIEKL